MKRKTEMDTVDQKLIRAILREIDARLNQGVLPVHNDHLEHLSDENDILEYLLHMKKEKLISGNLVTRGVNSAPYRMTNLRLTVAGIRMLRS